MEFNEKLQELRKQKGMTQEELAEVLFVSRTAVSKWESGRGYPNIESLKLISTFFSVTIDELLTGEQVMSIAEEDQKRKVSRFRDLVYGLLDVSVSMFFFLPFFGYRTGGAIQEVSLLMLSDISVWVKCAYLIAAIAIALFGVLLLALQNCQWVFWVRMKSKISLLLNTLGTFLFIISSQPYAAAFLFIILSIKVFTLIFKP